MRSATCLSGGGFTADSYDLYAIGIALKILADLYPQTTADASLITTIALVGSVVGQISGGLLADRIGRGRIFVASLAIIIFAVLGSSLLTGIFDAVYTELAVWRLILGFGVGIEYAVAPTVAHEQGGNVLLVFAMQGIGYVLAASVALACLAGGASLHFSWRMILGCGAIPSIAVFYPRVQMMREMEAEREAELSTERYSQHFTPLNQNFEQNAESGVPGGTEVSNRCYLAKQLSRVGETLHGANGYRWLFGTAFTWCVFDVSWYANTLFSATMLEAMGLGKSLPDQAKNALYVALIGVPGYFLSVFFAQAIGVRRLQIFGFMMCAILFFVMYMWLDDIKRTSAALLLVIYGLTFLFSNFGPNSTTFIAAVQIFPEHIRATCQGVSAAMGKVGAAIGSSALKPVQMEYGIDTVLLICVLLAVLGAIVSHLCLPRSLTSQAI